MRCAYCGVLNPADVGYCLKCGAPLEKRDHGIYEKVVHGSAKTPVPYHHLEFEARAEVLDVVKGVPTYGEWVVEDYKGWRSLIESIDFAKVFRDSNPEAYAALDPGDTAVLVITVDLA